MKNNILKNITILTAVSMLLMTVLIILSFVLVSTSDSKKELNTYANTCNAQIESFQSRDDLYKFAFYKEGSNIRITIANSEGIPFRDTNSMESLTSLNDKEQGIIDRLTSKDCPTGTNIESIFKAYKDQNSMYIQYSKVKVPYAVDENEFLIVRYSLNTIMGSTAFYILLISLAAFWILITIIVFILFWYNIRASMKPLEQVQAIMNDIQAGTYKSNPVESSVFDSEADKMVQQIDKIGDIINNNILVMEVVFDSIKQGIITFDRNGDFLYQNKAAKDLLGYDVFNVGGTRQFFKKLGFLEDAKEAFENKVETSLEFIVNEKILKAENIFISTDQMYELGINMILVISDITEEKNAIKYKNQFFADASHELKTPLTAITGYSEMLSISMNNEKTIKKCSDEISKNALRMKTLIEEMLQLSKMEGEKIEIDKETISLRNIMDSVVDDLSVIAKKNNVSISIEGDEIITANKKLIINLMKNLLSNAIKYNKIDGKVKVQFYKEDGQVIFDISDTGIGIEKENLPKIFDRFYRVEESRTTINQVESSTGLGLAIVQRIVDLHDAKIEVKSVFGEGTEFKITFKKED